LCDGLLLAAFAMTADPSTASSRPGIAVTARLAIFLKYCKGLGVEAKYLCKPSDVWPAPPKNPKKLLDCLEACAQLQYLLNEAKLPSLWAEEAAGSEQEQKKRRRSSHRAIEAAGKKKGSNDAEEEAAVVKKAEAEALAKTRAAEETKRKNAEAEAAGKKRAEDQAASRKRAEDAAAAKKLAEAEVAAKKRAEEEAASTKKAEEAVAAKRKAEAEAAAKKRADDAAAASSKNAEDVATKQSGTQPAVTAKTQANEGSAVAETKDEVAEKKKAEEKSQQVISNGAPSYMYVAPRATELLDIPLEEELPSLQGYLWKRSPNRLNLRSYQRRFVVLKHFCIYWWRQIDDAGDISSIGTSDSSCCRGRLDLEAQEVEVTSDPTEAGVFYVKPKQQWVPGASSDGDLLRTYVFSADGSEHSRRKWMEDIQVHIDKSQRARQGHGGATGPAAK